MGVCASSGNLSPAEQERDAENKAKSQALDNDMHDDQMKDSAIKKLLLLGAGESGKSTLFKQVNNLYGSGISEQERLSYSVIIFGNIILSMKSLLHATLELEHSEGLEIACSGSDIIIAMTGVEELTSEHGAVINELWKDAAIQKAYENRAKFQLTDSSEYFFNKIEEVCGESWVPSEQDVLRARVRTTGIIENDFEIQRNQFKMFDVGGQRNERKKWMHCFEDVTAVLFVGVLSEYNLVLYEDDTTNRMGETLNLFESIINSKWFIQTAIILFLNKRDLFAEKIAIHPLSDSPVFRRKIWNKDENLGPDDIKSEYADAEIEKMFPAINTYDGGCEAVRYKFIRRNKNQDKLIYTHYTCATDKENITVVFDAVKDIIIQNALEDAGLAF